jgi:hypothetical protein
VFAQRQANKPRMRTERMMKQCVHEPLIILRCLRNPHRLEARQESAEYSATARQTT